MLERPQSASDDAARCPPGRGSRVSDSERVTSTIGAHLESWDLQEHPHVHMCEEVPPEPKLSPFTTVLRE